MWEILQKRDRKRVGIWSAHFVPILEFLVTCPLPSLNLCLLPSLWVFALDVLCVTGEIVFTNWGQSTVCVLEEHYVLNAMRTVKKEQWTAPGNLERYHRGAMWAEFWRCASFGLCVVWKDQAGLVEMGTAFQTKPYSKKRHIGMKGQSKFGNGRHSGHGEGVGMGR